jgi:hypothetical protein
VTFVAILQARTFKVRRARVACKVERLRVGAKIQRHGLSPETGKKPTT